MADQRTEEIKKRSWKEWIPTTDVLGKKAAKTDGSLLAGTNTDSLYMNR